MGLSSLPTPSESVLTLVLVNTALTVSIVKELLRSALHVLGLRAAPPPTTTPEEPPEPSLTDRFRSRTSPVRFASAMSCRRPGAVDCRVCLARFEPDSVVNRLPCGHLFHKACLETWLDHSHATLDDINVLVDLVVGVSVKARENVVATLVNLVKCDRDKVIGDVEKVDKVEAIVRAMVDSDNRVSTRGKRKVETLLRVLERRRGSQL
ncbi:hypothetical protein BHE74_00051606 [Ensete ventricosum]|nr:hypothetical protein BHE74_00051606 [Ensete ventricosum]